MPAQQKGKTKYKAVKTHDRKKAKVATKDRVRQTNGLSVEEAEKLIRKSIQELNLTIYKTDGQDKTAEC